VPEQAIGASYGDALMAAMGVNLVAPETDWAKIEREITPNPANRLRYDELYGLWRELYPATRDVIHDLGKLGGRD
jgi:xylulokinase